MWHSPAILLGFEPFANRLLGPLLFPVLTTLDAIIQGWLRARSDSIWAPSLAHAAFDAGAVLLGHCSYPVARPAAAGTELGAPRLGLRVDHRASTTPSCPGALVRGALNGAFGVSGVRVAHA